MGRIGGFGDTDDTLSNPIWSTMDLFTYSSAGVHDYQDGRDGLATSFSYNGATGTLSSGVGLYFNDDYYSNGQRANAFDTDDSRTSDAFGIATVDDKYTISATDIRYWPHSVGFRHRRTSGT